MPRRIDTSSIEIGSSASSTCGFAARARAIATRWRWPPDSSCGNLSMYRVGRAQVDAVEQLGERLLQLVAAQAAAVDLEAAGQRVADRVHGVQRGERVLEDHLDLRHVPPEAGAALRLRVLAVQQDLAVGHGASAGRAAARSSTCRSRTRPRGRRRGRGRARGRRRRRRARPSSSGTRGRGSTCGSTRPAGRGSAPRGPARRLRRGLAWGQSSAHLGGDVRQGGRCPRVRWAGSPTAPAVDVVRPSSCCSHERHLTTTRDHGRLSWRA